MSVVEAGIGTELTAEVEALIQQGQAFAEREQFDQVLNDRDITLSSYAQLLMKQGNNEKSLEAPCLTLYPT